MIAWALVLLGAVSLLAAAEGVVLYFAVKAVARLISVSDEAARIANAQLDSLRRRIDSQELQTAELQLASTDEVRRGSAEAAVQAAGALDVRLIEAEAKLERLTLKSGFR